MGEVKTNNMDDLENIDIPALEAYIKWLIDTPIYRPDAFQKEDEQ